MPDVTMPGPDGELISFDPKVLSLAVATGATIKGEKLEEDERNTAAAILIMWFRSVDRPDKEDEAQLWDWLTHPDITAPEVVSVMSESYESEFGVRDGQHR